mmetsp:Transcript_13302/g.20200  ORF Transcript_13302/g.20200 Transcript_13302/m.20200 type:complete len:501 (-) Transcript_13302:71-1573(-)|eukprot:CAMPEP_0196821962 /NCGR_PEP_ID=MMETSP1362-20130617/81681_1 /TAXON_ID=163516 /ORGANISM="Leptocylindrus danicus, Strain CCMP1856" /LENGTH=500 /DNA_ID=CAMNT_0042201359 /DNA_START=53 /DNA_END=1555 /DNA_ORIENTATION=-
MEFEALTAGMSIFGIIFTLIAAFVIQCTVNMIIWRMKLRHIPGPAPWPVVGHMLMKDGVLTTKFLRRHTKTYGKIFQYWPGWKPMVVVLHPDQVKQVLTDSHIFVKGPEYVEKFGTAFGSGLVTSNGDKHKGDRKLMGRFFVRSNVEKYLPIMSAHANLMFEEMLDAASEEELADRDISYVFHYITNHMIHKFVVGVDCTKSDEGREWIEWFSHFINWANDVVGKAIILGIPLSRSKFSIARLLKNCNQLNSNMDTVHLKCDDMVADRKKLRAERPEEEPDDILKCMLDAKLTKLEIRDHFMTTLAAGHDTTSWLLSYTAYLLAQHPEVQSKLKAEINEVVGDKKEITPEIIKELKYMEMVIKEALRYYAVIPYLPRLATRDVTLRGVDVKIPKGCTVLVSMAILNRDSDTWTDPHKFIPERFENIADQDMRRGYIPFAYGTRRCIGMAFAQVEAVVVLSLLLQKYTLSPVEGYKPQPLHGISLQSANGMHVKISKDKKM